MVDRVTHLILPAAMLGLVHAAAWSRYVKGGVADAAAQPFVFAAAARGAPRRVILYGVHRRRPACRSSRLCCSTSRSWRPVPSSPSVFAWPGLGSLFTEALARRDYTLLMALLMLASTAVVVFNLIADVCYAFVDPRVRL